MELEDALIKARYYCAQQERSTFEIKRKLYNWKVPEKQFEIIIAHLIDTDFLSEKRFAQLYAKSKLNQGKWGILKIRAALLKHEINQPIIEETIGDLDQEKIRENMEMLAKKKLDELNQRGAEQKPEKLKFFLASKGYETEQIFDFLNNNKYDND